jgi:acyl carrier protein
VSHTSADIRDVVLRALTSIAPEIDPQSLDGGIPIRDQVDLDSMDYLNFMIAVSTELGVDIPEAHYTRLATLDSAVEYLMKATAAT